MGVVKKAARVSHTIDGPNRNRWFTELKMVDLSRAMLNNQMVIVAFVSEGITELPGRGEAEHGHEAKRKQSTTGHNPCLFHDEMGMVQNL